MCGRYHLKQESGNDFLEGMVAQAQKLAERLNTPMKSGGDLRLTDVVPVIAASAVTRKIGAFPMRWGFLHPTRGMLVFNTRSETAAEKSMFQGSIDLRRCLIPASFYYEWQKQPDGKKIRHAFSPIDGGMLYLAGLYVKPNGPKALPCFSILTRDADAQIRSIHARMPLLVPFDRLQEWLDPHTPFHEIVQSLHVSVHPEIK